MPAPGFRRFTSRSRRRKRVVRSSRTPSTPPSRLIASPVAHGAHAGSNALTSSPPIRQELVDRVRAEIQAGTYDTPEKFNAALERMVRRWTGE